MSSEMIPYQDVEKMGKNIADSGLFGVKTASQAVALMLVAQALGKHPALAAMEFHIIQGRPAKKSDAMLSDFQASGGKVEWHELTDLKAEATFTHPQGGSVKLAWDIDRAKKAGLIDKDGSMYKKYPRSMLRARLISEGVRTVYPAATGGMRSVEEFEESSESEHTVDTKKSRLDNIIDAQVEPETVNKNKDEKNDPETGDKKDTAKVFDVSSVPKPSVIAHVTLKEGEKLAQGHILEAPKVATVEKDGKPTPKYSFKMGEFKYGTFDKNMFENICSVLDMQRKHQEDDKESKILLNIIYIERAKDGKVLRDITGFSQASLNKVVPI